MDNGTKTQKFLDATDTKTKDAILGNIATHYGISKESALSEITDPEAEHLLDYVTGPQRAATHVLMKRHGLA